MNAIADLPPGMWANNLGGYTPEAVIRPQTKLEDQLVRDLLRKAADLRDAIAAFRSQSFEDVDTHMHLLAEQYGVKRRGAGGNYSLETFDGLRRVQVATGDFVTFGPELQMAKNLVDDCLERWTEGGNDNVRAIVTDAFDVGREGKIRVDRILALRRLDIHDEVWVRAMAAINDAVRVSKTKRYIRFYERASLDDKFAAVSLDIAAVV